MKERTVAVRKAELKSMGLPQLKELITSNRLESGSKQEAMIAAIVAHEAKRREELRVFNVKASEVVAKKKEELESKTGAELKDLCVAKELATGVGKEEKVARLLEKATVDGEADAIVSNILRNERMEELLGMDESALLLLCSKTGSDPCVKEVMIERILDDEDEVGMTEPLSKKVRRCGK